MVQTRWLMLDWQLLNCYLKIWTSKKNFFKFLNDYFKLRELTAPNSLSLLNVFITLGCDNLSLSLMIRECIECMLFLIYDLNPRFQLVRIIYSNHRISVWQFHRPINDYIFNKWLLAHNLALKEKIYKTFQIDQLLTFAGLSIYLMSFSNRFKTTFWLCITTRRTIGFFCITIVKLIHIPYSYWMIFSTWQTNSTLL